MFSLPVGRRPYQRQSMLQAEWQARRPSNCVALSPGVFRNLQYLVGLYVVKRLDGSVWPAENDLFGEPVMAESEVHPLVR